MTEADRKADIGSLVLMQQSQDNGVAVKWICQGLSNYGLLLGY